MKVEILIDILINISKRKYFMYYNIINVFIDKIEINQIENNSLIVYAELIVKKYNIK